jgi:hypothetical protein
MTVTYHIFSGTGATCVLASSGEHPRLDPQAEFQRLIGIARNASDLAERCLALRYPEDGGTHVAGDRVFVLPDHPTSEADLTYCAMWVDGKPRVAKSSDFPEPPPLERRVEAVEMLKRWVQDEPESLLAAIDEDLILMIMKGHVIYMGSDRFIPTSIGFAQDMWLI